MMQVAIPVIEVLRPVAELALVRLGYLNPKLTFKYLEHSIVVSSLDVMDEAQIRRDVLYALYREKIYAETLPMRKALVNLVSAT